MDSKLFPEGTHAVRTFGQYLHLDSASCGRGCSSWGVYAAFLDSLQRNRRHRPWTTTSDSVLWITFDLAVIALGAGAFFSGLPEVHS